MAGLLSQARFEIADSEQEADLVIVNTCTVKQPTQTKVLRYLEEQKQAGKRIIVAGCLAQATPELLEGYSLIGTNNIHDIVPVVEEVLNGNTVTLIAQDSCPRLRLPKLRKNPVVEILPICQGCLGECSYCIVRQARGTLRSYSSEEILQAASQALKEGVQEIWLTAQDTGCYGLDIGTDLPSLLRKLVALPGRFWLRVGMMNPNHLQGFLPELAELYRSEKVFRFLHVPVQSGNDLVLQRMGRPYSVQQFRDAVGRFREIVPDVTLATDVICGFPGEAKEQFQDSVQLIQSIQPDIVNISRFWPRPKTPAAEMEGLSGEETKDRSRYLTTVFEYVSYEKNRKWKGWEGDILIDEPGKDSTFIGRNFAYKPFVVQERCHLGQRLRVQVTGSTSYDLRAAVLKS